MLDKPLLGLEGGAMGQRGMRHVDMNHDGGRLASERDQLAASLRDF